MQQTGVFVTTTGEAPGTNRLEIVGTKGKLVTEATKVQQMAGAAAAAGGGTELVFTKNSVDLSDAIHGAEISQEIILVDVPAGARAIASSKYNTEDMTGALHVAVTAEITDDTEAILDNFFNSILDPAVELISHAPDGINGVELANAMVYGTSSRQSP